MNGLAVCGGAQKYANLTVNWVLNNKHETSSNAVTSSGCLPLVFIGFLWD